MSAGLISIAFTMQDAQIVGEAALRVPSTGNAVFADMDAGASGAENFITECEGYLGIVSYARIRLLGGVEIRLKNYTNNIILHLCLEYSGGRFRNSHRQNQSFILKK